MLILKNVCYTNRSDIGKLPSETWWGFIERIYPNDIDFAKSGSPGILSPKDIDAGCDRPRILRNMQSRHEKHYKDSHEAHSGAQNENDHDEVNEDKRNPEDFKTITDTLEHFSEKTLSSALSPTGDTPPTAFASRIMSGSLKFDFDTGHLAANRRPPLNIRERLDNTLDIRNKLGLAETNPILIFHRGPNDIPDLLRPDVSLLCLLQTITDCDKAIRDLVRIPHDPLRRGIKPNPNSCPTIKSHLAHWNCNRKQWYAAGLMCVAVLDSIVKSCQVNAVNFEEHQRGIIYENATSKRVKQIIEALDTAAYFDRPDLKLTNDDGTDSDIILNLKKTATIRLLTLGSAGGGKSHVIKCENDFARAWGASRMVANIAPRGVSAMNIRGVTYFHALGLNIYGHDGSAASKPEPKETEATDNLKPPKRNLVKEAWSTVGVTNFDEVCLTPGNQFDTAYSKITTMSEMGERQMHFNLGGDLQQPTANKPLFKQLKSNYDDCYIGNTKFHTMLNCCIELTDQERCSDETWYNQTSRLAYNVHTKEDIASWNSERCAHVNSKLTAATVLCIPKGGTMVSSLNQDCQNYNLFLHRLYAQQKPVDPENPGHWKDRGILLVLADVDILDITKDEVSIQDRIRALHYRQTKEISTSLVLCTSESFTYRTSKNKEVAKGHTNGTTCTFYDLILNDPDKKVAFKKNATWGGGIHVIYAKDVHTILLRHNQDDWKDSYYADPSYAIDYADPNNLYAHANVSGLNDLVLPLGVFPLATTKAAITYKKGPHTAKIRVFPSPTIINRSILSHHCNRTSICFHYCYPDQVNINGPMLISSNVCTPESLQGLTKDFLFVLDTGKHKRNTDGMLFMLWTRVKEGKQFHMLGQLPLMDGFFPKRNMVLVETYKLRTFLCNRTYRICHDIFDDHSIDLSPLTSPLTMTQAEYDRFKHLAHDSTGSDNLPPILPSKNANVSIQGAHASLKRAPTTTQYNLKPEYYDMLKSGSKDIEIRRINGANKATPAIGDLLHFKCQKQKNTSVQKNTQQPPALIRRIIGKHVADSIEKLLTLTTANRVLPNHTFTEALFALSALYKKGKFSDEKYCAFVLENVNPEVTTTARLATMPLPTSTKMVPISQPSTMLSPVRQVVAPPAQSPSTELSRFSLLGISSPSLSNPDACQHPNSTPKRPMFRAARQLWQLQSTNKGTLSGDDVAWRAPALVDTKQADLVDTTRRTPTFVTTGLLPAIVDTINSPPRRQNSRPGRVYAIPATPLPKVAPKQPVFMAAVLVDSSLQNPQTLSTNIRNAFQRALVGGFLVWSDNMCHFDSVLMLNMVAFDILGVEYWRDADGNARELSRTERWSCDLLCSYTGADATQMQHLRNVFMWHALEASGQYGSYVDAMVHAFAAPDDVLDKYHSIERVLVREHSAPCTCSGHPTTTIQGCVQIRKTTRHDDQVWQTVDLEQCIKHGLMEDFNVDMTCQSSVQGVPGIHCEGRYRNVAVRITMPALLVVAVDVGFAPTLKLMCTIGTYSYYLVGLCLFRANHYICRFRRSTSSSDWFVYDDNAKPGGHNPEGARVIASKSNPLDNPVVHHGAPWFVRGLWFVQTQSHGQPVNFDFGNFRH